MRRVDLHSTLEEITIVKEEREVPVTIAASSQAVDVDFEKNTPIQENGERDNGSVSADGKPPCP